MTVLSNLELALVCGNTVSLNTSVCNMGNFTKSDMQTRTRYDPFKEFCSLHDGFHYSLNESLQRIFTTKTPIRLAVVLQR